MGLHGALHSKAQFGDIGAALGVAHAIKAIQAGLTRLGRQRRLGSAGLDGFRRAMRCRTAKHHQVKQRIRAEAVRTMDGNASRFTHRHQALYHAVLILRGWVQHFGVDVRGDAAHIVMHGRQDGDGFLGHIHARENLGGFGNPRQAFMQNGGAQMFQMQMDMITLGPHATAFSDFHGHGARNHIAARQILGRRRIAFHETLAF